MSLILGSRFIVTFFIGGLVPNPLDFKFQRVSGLSSTVQTTTVNEGGENRFAHRLPKGVEYGNLVLERGFNVNSLLNVEFAAAMNAFKFAPSNVLVMALDDTAWGMEVPGRIVPVAAWMFMRAYPVRWATADLNASDEQVLIDTLELAYQHMVKVPVPGTRPPDLLTELGGIDPFGGIA